jgi:lysyl-tRNA synthetase class 2
MKRDFTEQELIRREKLQQLKDLERDPYFSSFKNGDSIKDINIEFANHTKEELHDSPTRDFSIAGRVMMVRDQGKAMFLALKSDGNNFQIYLREDSVSETD